MLLSETQKNEVLNIVRKYRLNPSDFRWEIDMSRFSHDPILYIYHDHRCCYFRFDFKEGIHFTEYSSGEDKPIEKAYPGEWNGQLLYFERWVSLLRRETEVSGLEQPHRNVEEEVIYTLRNRLRA
jgi:hypothetical protein